MMWTVLLVYACIVCLAFVCMLAVYRDADVAFLSALAWPILLPILLFMAVWHSLGHSKESV